MTKQGEIALHLSSEINSAKSQEIIKRLKNSKERFAILTMKPCGRIKRVIIMDYVEERNAGIDQVVQSLKETQFLFVVRYKKHVCYMIMNTV